MFNSSDSESTTESDKCTLFNVLNLEDYFVRIELNLQNPPFRDSRGLCVFSVLLCLSYVRSFKSEFSPSPGKKYQFYSLLQTLCLQEVGLFNCVIYILLVFTPFLKTRIYWGIWLPRPQFSTRAGLNVPSEPTPSFPLRKVKHQDCVSVFVSFET